MPNFSDLMISDAKQVLDWLTSVAPQSIRYEPDLQDSTQSTDFNWLGLGEIATSKYSHGVLTGPVDLGWAEVAVIVYEALANNASNLALKRKLQRPLFIVRSSLIGGLGHVPNNRVLDVETLISQCIENLQEFPMRLCGCANSSQWPIAKGLSYQEAIEKTSWWKAKYKVEKVFEADAIAETDRPLLEQFRNINESLWPLKIAAESGRWQPQGEVADWLELERKLNSS